MGIKNRVWVLMGKKLSGSLNADEEQELDRLFQTYPDIWYTYEVLNGLEENENIPDDFINEIQTLLKYDDKEPAKIHNATIAAPRRVRRIWAKFAVAAVALFVVSLIGYKYLDNTGNKNNEIVVAYGSKTDVTLPDGSRVILNSGSKLTYPKNYSSLTTREIFLSGEAYFKVVHDEKHPFIIHTPHFDIKDIGTTFNVKAYPEEKITEATLIEGAIEIAFKNNITTKILLKPHQKAVLINNALNKSDIKAVDKPDSSYTLTTLTPESENDFEETAWINNELVFKNETFEDLAKKMERRYNVEIVFENEKLKSSRLTGRFKNENIVQALKMLQLISPFKYQINHDKIFISAL